MSWACSRLTCCTPSAPMSGRSSTWRETLEQGGPWLLGEQVTLADITMMPFVARLAYLGLLDVWVADRPHIKAWWERVQQWPSFKTRIERPHQRNRIRRDGDARAEDPRAGGGAAARGARRHAGEDGVAAAHFALSPIQLPNSRASSPTLFGGRRVRPYFPFASTRGRGDGAPSADRTLTIIGPPKRAGISFGCFFSVGLSVRPSRPAWNDQVGHEGLHRLIALVEVVVRILTRPRVGCERDGRTSITSHSMRSRSPGRTGRGQRSSSRPPPTMPPASGGPSRTSRPMVSDAVCQPLAARPPKKVSAAAASSR